MDRKLFHSTVLRVILVFVLLLAAGGGAAQAGGRQVSLPAAPSSGAAESLVTTQSDGFAVLSFTTIAAGSWHTCGLVGGGVKCWGSNSSGQLGNDTRTTSSLPVNVSGLSSGVTAIAAGATHTCALAAGGVVKCWGRNNYGQLGNGTNTSSNTPVEVAGLGSSVIAIATGNYHTCAVASGGAAKCWGRNITGELGNGTTTDSNLPVPVTGLGSGVLAIAAGGQHSCAVVTGGAAKCWGSNSFGQLGNGTWDESPTPVDVSGLSSDVLSITGGFYHTCALISGGGAKCWGANFDGQLGNGTWANNETPVDVSDLSSGVLSIDSDFKHTCALISGGGVKCWGHNRSGQLGNGTTTNSGIPVDVTELASGVTAIAAGWYHTCTVTADGAARCWGSNGAGQLGNGRLLMRSMPFNLSGLTNGVSAIAGGESHTCAVTAGGGVKCWGWNDAGQLGNGTTIDSSVPLDVTGLASGGTAVSTGLYHSCALVAGVVKCWGYNYYGQLGNGTTSYYESTPVDVVGLPSGVIAIAAGGEHTCALLGSGSVKCWGHNNFGQLGNGTTTDVDSPINVTGLSSGVIAIAASGEHTCALLTGGSMKCWGFNAYGQLGNGNTNDQYTPVSVTGFSSGATTITAGGEYDGGHTCAVVAGVVKCWGDNTYGQLGNGSTTPSSVPVDVTGLPVGVTALALGYYHSCALAPGGAVKCWGWNLTGQLGDGTIANSLTPVNVEGLASGATGVATGGYHTCALAGSGRPLCWGGDAAGELGIGTISQSLTPVDVVESVSPYLTINYPNGQPGSFFTIGGWNFPPGSQATVAINGQVLTATLPVSPTGSFIFFLDSSGASEGGYLVTVSANPSAIIGFSLAGGDPIRPIEGGGQTFTIPPGIPVQLLYLPLVRR